MSRTCTTGPPQEAGGAREVEASGATVRELLEDLASGVPALGEKVYDGSEIRPYVNVYVDGEDVRTSGGLDAPVRDDATVVLLPAMAGGMAVARSLLDLIGNTPLVSSRASRRRGVKIYAKLEAQNPTGSIKDRVALAMVDAAGLEPGATARADEREHGDLARARREAARAQADVRDAGERDAGAAARARAVRRRRSSTRRRTRAPTGLYGSRRRWPPDPRYTMLFQYANEWNPRAHYEGTGAEIVRDLPRVDALVAGLGTGGTLMGTGARLREAFPDVVVAAAEPLPGDPVMGLRSLDDGYVPPILDVSKLDRKMLVSNAESVAAVHGAARPRGDLRRRLRRGGRPRRPEDRRGAPGGLGRRRGARRRRLEVPLRRLLGD